METKNKYIVASPFVENLLGELKNIDPVFRKNKKLIKFRSLRNKLSQQFRKINSLNFTEDTLWENACKEKVNRKDIKEFYILMTAFLNEDTFHRRLLLYFPLEYLPSTRIDNPDKTLNMVRDNFIILYKKRWYELIEDLDAEVDFTNGDIQEIEIRSEEPKLIKKGLELIPHLMKIGVLIQNNVPFSYKPLLKKEQGNSLSNFNISSIQGLFTLINHEVEVNLSKLKAREKEVHKSRSEWEYEENTNNTIHKMSRILEFLVDKRSLTHSCIIKLIKQRRSTIFTKIAIKFFTTLILKGILIKREDLDSLCKLYKESNFLVKKDIRKLLLYARSFKLLSDDDLLQIDIQKTDFSKSLDLEKVLSKEFKFIIESLERLEDNLVLMKYIEPVVLLSGSKIKGYSNNLSDTDLSVFIKPNISEDKLEEIRMLLIKHFDDPSIKGNILQFWLNNEDGYLLIKDHDRWEKDLGRSFYSHSLLQGFYIGKQKVINKLFNSLLMPYLFDNISQYGEVSGRNLWLKEMERDALQYRLLHRGYEEENPILENIDSPNNTFWNSGYRKVATQLYIDKVFLPYLGN